MSHVISALAAFALTAVLLPLLIPFLKRRSGMAVENNRSMHRGLIPKGGGAVLLGVTVLVTAASGHVAALQPLTALAIALVTILSWRDDVGHLSPLIRFPVHALAAILCVAALPSQALVFQGLLPTALDRIITVVALMWMTNLYNFMDGINGMAGTETVAIALGYVLIGAMTGGLGAPEALAASVAGAAGGFLIWNARPVAKVFLGDVGSIPLGLLMGVLMMDLAVRGEWAAALILPSYFLADATLTLIKRLARGERVWQAHRSHFYQQAAARLGSHLEVVAWVAVADTLLIAAAILSLSHAATGLALAAVIVVALLWLMQRTAFSGL